MFTAPYTTRFRRRQTDRLTQQTYRYGLPEAFSAALLRSCRRNRDMRSPRALRNLSRRSIQLTRQLQELWSVPGGGT